MSISEAAPDSQSAPGLSVGCTCDASELLLRKPPNQCPAAAGAGSRQLPGPSRARPGVRWDQRAKLEQACGALSLGKKQSEAMRLMYLHFPLTAREREDDERDAQADEWERQVLATLPDAERRFQAYLRKQDSSLQQAPLLE